MIHGLVLVNKSGGMTSHDVVDEIRRIFKMKKVGHFGTLDPLAEGLILIGLGNATKFFDYYIKKKKIYSGKITFGYSTSTYDAEGEPSSEQKDINLSSIDIKALLAHFTGSFMQMPPLYSAKKFKGKPMYKYARANKEDQVVIKPGPVDIYKLTGKVLDPVTLWFRAETSSGTYIRSLAHDMGQRTGSGAFLKELIREGVGEFSLTNAFTLESIKQVVGEGDITRIVTPIEALLPEFPKIVVTPGGRDAILNGNPLMPRDVYKVYASENTEKFRIFDDDGHLLALAVKDPRLMQFKPFVVFPID